MIYDKIEKVKLYKNIPSEAIEFMYKLRPDIKTGRYVLSDSIYANVETYTTRAENACKFEAHREYIDIQILLKGKEKIYYTDKQGLKISETYNENKDIEFYSDTLKNRSSIVLDGSNFVVLFPHEAHAPQVNSDFSREVLKVVIKIPANM